MSRPLALFFAVVGTLLLCSIAIALSFRNLWLVLLSVLASVGFIGYGFVLKAKIRRKSQK
ncbi:DUF5325 family protein [Paenibacillus thermoaerophilus]|uniref:DUF5325 family protein n=1 Tax=Paenibacillus thermoaerophilus TaxID=1215385 RepID=A0ABW2V188_9BACL|nr:DUF5325 family protein [Paenibacillus thermoaerophilus]TMV18462.1 hypothetical protein FE781_03355 [Paenibacillus thermoaerophilus]